MNEWKKVKLAQLNKEANKLMNKIQKAWEELK